MKSFQVIGVVIILFLSQVIYINVGHPVSVSAQAVGAENVPPFVEVLPDVSAGKAPLSILDYEAGDVLHRKREKP